MVDEKNDSGVEKRSWEWANKYAISRDWLFPTHGFFSDSR